MSTDSQEFTELDPAEVTSLEVLQKQASYNTRKVVSLSKDLSLIDKDKDSEIYKSITTEIQSRRIRSASLIKRRGLLEKNKKQREKEEEEKRQKVIQEELALPDLMVDLKELEKRVITLLDKAEMSLRKTRTLPVMSETTILYAIQRANQNILEIIKRIPKIGET
jgi:hypothetical protein